MTYYQIISYQTAALALGLKPAPGGLWADANGRLYNQLQVTALHYGGGV